MITDRLLIELDKKRDLKKDSVFCEELAASLHTFYIECPNHEKEILSIIGKSSLDSQITLMPRQLEMLYSIEKHKNICLSAPTSFGKSYVILEYIKRLKNKPHLVIYVVHTKSLCTEVLNNIKSYFSDDYNVIDDFESIEDSCSNILVMISDGQNVFTYFERISSIDLLIIDEAYNLGQKDNVRYLTIYNSCLELMKRSKKTILAGPYIKTLTENDQLGFNFQLYKSDYSPVTEIIKEGKDVCGKNPSDVFMECLLNNQSTIGFVNSKSKIYNELFNISKNNALKECYTDSFIEWMKNYFPDFWILPKLMEKGVSVYHSSFPKYINLYSLDLFNKGKIKGLLTTSAILEGVNTAAKNIVIYETESGRGDSITLTPFQFFNLCGRAGRLKREIVGNIFNFGSLFSERYNERSLDLVIGLENETGYEKFDMGIYDEETTPIKIEIAEKLLGVGINFDDWYQKSKFYFGNRSKKLLSLINSYLNFRAGFKNAISSSLLKSNGEDLNKPSTLTYIYEHFVKTSNCEFKEGWGINVPFTINELITSSYGGIAFSMKDFCSKSKLFQYVESLNNPIVEKNKLIVMVMKIAYSYIQYEYNYVNSLLKDFIAFDSYFDETEKKKINEAYFNRISRYLMTSTDTRINKYLLDLGIIPPLIPKIISLIKTSIDDVSKITNKQIYNIVKNLLDSNAIGLTDYERINLENVKII